MPLVDIEGASLYHERLGNGPPLLLLAGMASDGASWAPVIEPLAARHELIVVDNRASGRTRDAGAPLSRDVMVADIIALLDALELERVAILGHSMGGMLGWAIAARAPSRVSALVPVAALPVASAARVELFATLARVRARGDEADWFRLLFQFLFRPVFFDDGAAVEAAVAASLAYPHKQGAEAFARQAAALASFAEPLDLSSVTCPVHPLCGAEDVLSPPFAHAAFHATVGRAALGTSGSVAEPRVVERAAHAVHWDRPDAVVAHLSTVLDDTARDRRAGRVGHMTSDDAVVRADVLDPGA